MKKLTDYQMLRFSFKRIIAQAFDQANIKLNRTVLHLYPKDYEEQLSAIKYSRTLSSSIQNLQLFRASNFNGSYGDDYSRRMMD